METEMQVHRLQETLAMAAMEAPPLPWPLIQLSWQAWQGRQWKPQHWRGTGAAIRAT